VRTGQLKDIAVRLNNLEKSSGCLNNFNTILLFSHNKNIAFKVKTRTKKIRSVTVQKKAVVIAIR
jgi:hypothetical protein